MNALTPFAPRAASPGARVVIVANHCNPSFRERARQLGAAESASKEDLLALPQILSSFRNPPMSEPIAP